MKNFRAGWFFGAFILCLSASTAAIAIEDEDVAMDEGEEAMLANSAQDPDTVMLGDMVVERDALEVDGNPSSRGAAKARVKLWQDGVLPIVFHKSISSEKRKQFFDACKIWEGVANVKCKKGYYKRRRLWVTQSKLGCFSLWGMGFHFVALRRWMNLQATGCWSQSTLLHEMGHALGLIHEHQRSDRDDFVTIHSKNADKGILGLNVLVNFNHQGSNPLTPYDFRSIMHYSRVAFSKNGNDTIVPKPGYEEYLNIIGRVPSISESDAKAMAALYGPPSQSN